MARYYDDPVFPYFARNVAFGLIPGGMFFLFMASAAFLWSRSESVAIGLFLAGMFCGGLCWFVTLEPPTVLKPEWMRAGEGWAGDAQSQAPTYEDGDA